LILAVTGRMMELIARALRSKTTFQHRAFAGHYRADNVARHAVGEMSARCWSMELTAAWSANRQPGDTAAGGG
jgi:hypothetical protein